MHSRLSHTIWRLSVNLSRGLNTSARIMAPIKVGDALPNVDLYEDNPGTKVNTKEAFGTGKHVIFAIPGAFTPTCQNDHFPTYVEQCASLTDKGVKSINCVSVNDPFVMAAFCQKMNATGKVRCLADTCGELTKALDLELDVVAALGNARSKRYAMVVEDGKVTALNVEEDSSKASCTTAPEILGSL